MQEPDKRSWLLPATISLILIPASAGASGFALLEQSASRLGTAFAGTATAAVKKAVKAAPAAKKTAVKKVAAKG